MVPRPARSWVLHDVGPWLWVEQGQAQDLPLGENRPVAVDPGAGEVLAVDVFEARLSARPGGWLRFSLRLLGARLARTPKAESRRPPPKGNPISRSGERRP